MTLAKNIPKELLKQLKIIVKDINSKTKVEEGVKLLYDLAVRDPKTHLYNYRFFESVFDMEMEKASRGAKLSLVIMDLDFFKQINSKYGHIKADELLVNVAKIIKKFTRKSDIVARFGGEEFILLLPNTKLSQARIVCERIRQNIESDLKKFSVTISGGVSEYREDDTPAIFKHRTDSLLAIAKENGRNRIEYC